MELTRGVEHRRAGHFGSKTMTTVASRVIIPSKSLQHWHPTLENDSVGRVEHSVCPNPRAFVNWWH